jgi:hypothetical protein
VEEDVAIRDASSVGEKIEYAERDGRFAGAAFTGDDESSAFSQRKGYIVDGLHDAVLSRELGGKLFDAEDRIGQSGPSFSWGRWARRFLSDYTNRALYGRSQERARKVEMTLPCTCTLPASV